jgi:tetratricopeptide (TPR) repeat protein
MLIYRFKKMKKSLFVFLALIISIVSLAQPNKIDSLTRVLKVEKRDTKKVWLLWNLAQAYNVYKPDTSLVLAEQAHQLAQKIKDVEGESRSLNQIANAFNRIGNYPKALEFYIQKLKIEEQRHNAENLGIVYMNIATVYLSQGEYKSALNYSLTADSIIVKNNVERLKWYSLLNLAEIFEKYNKLDSAIEYINRAYRIAVKSGDDDFIGSTLNNMGNICSKTGNLDLALSNYREGLSYLKAANDEDVICETSIGLARVFLKTGARDSALFYARVSYELSKADGFLSRNLEASTFLKDYFKSKNIIDSAYKYQEQMIFVKDSIGSRERIKEAQIISMDEQLRQKELNDLRMKEKQETKKRLQFLAIGITLPLLFLITIFLSRRRVRPRVVESAGIISLLLLFEYVTLLLHPFVLELTNHIPVFELLVFAAIAAVLTRAHHRFEHLLIQVLSRKKQLFFLKEKLP